MCLDLNGNYLKLNNLKLNFRVAPARSSVPLPHVAGGSPRSHHCTKFDWTALLQTLSHCAFRTDDDLLSGASLVRGGLAKGPLTFVLRSTVS